MNLTIDIGNTRTKLAVFDGDELLGENTAFSRADNAADDEACQELRALVACYKPTGVAYCSVANEGLAIEQALKSLTCRVLHVTGTTPTPLQVLYHTPETLGADRLAAVVGAVTLQPRTDLLVIDAGTCITYDLVDSLGHYLGGNISPGVEMRFEALHRRTARLPRVSAEGDAPEVGYDTETALRAGVVRGIGYELQGCIRHLQKRYPRLRVYLTGGDRYVFSDSLREDILTDSHLVARGLNRLLLEQLADPANAKQ